MLAGEVQRPSGHVLHDCGMCDSPESVLASIEARAMWNAHTTESQRERVGSHVSAAARARVQTRACRNFHALRLRTSSQISNFRFEIAFVAADHDPARARTPRCSSGPVRAHLVYPACPELRRELRSKVPTWTEEPRLFSPDFIQKSRFLIATAVRLEIDATHTQQTTKLFLIAAETATLRIWRSPARHLRRVARFPGQWRPLEWMSYPMERKFES